MKRILIIINLLIIGNMLLAQIPFDRNYRLIFEDNFDEELVWGNDWISTNRRWVAFAREWPTGVIFDAGSRSVCRKEQCQTDGQGHLNIISKYVPGGIPDSMIILPPQKQDVQIPAYTKKFRYFSGMIESFGSFHFGYFEIRCKLPIHRGAFPSFWTFGTNHDTYEEIDFFEYFHNPEPDGIVVDDSSRVYSVGIWYNPNDESYDGADRVYANDVVKLSEDEPSINEWTVFGCDWRPGYIRWYRNGKIIHTCYDPDFIPQNELRIKVNYTIDSAAQSRILWYPFSDTLAIDYIRIYELKDLDSSDVTIRHSWELCDTSLYSPKLTINFKPRMQDTLYMVDSTYMFHATNKIFLHGPIKIHNNYVMFDVNKGMFKNDDD